ncbi:nadh-cytochrome b5 reductase 1 [Paramyrothecium foliicola]|nr:nadh-cytochrome b5 reductase 1 [Paramyrothecium foliicola]
MPSTTESSIQALFATITTHWEVLVTTTALLLITARFCDSFTWLKVPLGKLITRQSRSRYTIALKPDVFQEFALERKTEVSHNVSIYRFKLPFTDSILGLPVGQHISIGANILQNDGSSEEVIRSYTPISDDDALGYFDLLVKTYPNGNISRHLAGLVPGQLVRVRGPKGNFTYRPNMVKHVGMIAGGTGIAPMIQVIRAIVRGRANGDKTEVDLLLANVTAQDILLKAELDDFASNDDKIRVHYVLDKPPAGWSGGVGYVTAEMIRKWLPKPTRNAQILLCGPPPMVSGLRKTLLDLGFKKPDASKTTTDQVFAF